MEPEAPGLKIGLGQEPGGVETLSDGAERSRVREDPCERGSEPRVRIGV